MAYTFLKAQGHAIGSSLCEEDKLELASQLLRQAVFGFLFMIADVFQQHHLSVLQRSGQLLSGGTYHILGHGYRLLPQLGQPSDKIRSNDGKILRRWGKRRKNRRKAVSADEHTE